MKTFIVCMLIIPAVFSQDYGCKQTIQAARDFNLDRYFEGIWYLVAAQHAYSSDKDVCEQSSGEVLYCGGVVRQNISQYLSYVKRFLHSESLTFLSDFDDGSATYTSVQKYINKFTPDLHELQIVPTTIIATDYDTYSVVYTCTRSSNEDNGNIESNYFVLRRSVTDETKAADIARILHENGADYSEFVFRKNVNCPEEPDF